MFDFTQNHICWTTTPYSTEALQKLPYVWMQGFQQDWSDAAVSVVNWMTRFKDATIAGGLGGGNPYKGLYHGEKKTLYKLPYFNEYHHSISQSWQENQGPAGELVKKLTDFAETAGKVLFPAAGIVFPKSYAGGTAATYSFNFTLINTYRGTSNQTLVKNMKKNKAFLETFISDNLHGQNGSLAVDPPLLYEVYIPGIRWSPAAVISGLNIVNKGSMNMAKSLPDMGATEYIFPDAWEVQVTIQELINESRSIWADAAKGKGPYSGITTRTINT